MLWPHPDEVDAATVYAADSRPPPGDRPWVVADMIASADGSAVDQQGVAGGLGGPADREVFAALRSVADVILAGANTVRTERYGPARTPPEQQRARVERGQQSVPRIAVVSGTLDLDPDLRLFRESSPEAPPIVITTAASLAEHAETRGHLAGVAEIVVAGDSALDWDVALAKLTTEAGAGVLVVEGGPRTNAQLLAADLIDELCLTIAPVLAGGAGLRIIEGRQAPEPRGMALDRILTADDGYLLLRYVRRRDGA
jgi:riboflavin biosynthesis pyrimidine reductase